MDIQAIKQQVKAFETTDDRAKVYELLKEAWNKHKSSELASLIVKQMIDYLLWLDMGSPQEKWEYDSYKALLVDTVNYGSLNYLDDKLFLWLMVYYLSGYATYYWLLDTPIARKGFTEEVTEELVERAKQLFPNSLMFRVMPYILKSNPTWINSLSLTDRETLKTELTELHLQDNNIDEEIKEWLGLKLL